MSIKYFLLGLAVGAHLTKQSPCDFLSFGDISPKEKFSDMSDEISGIQQFKFIADWFCISYSYAKWPARVKPKPKAALFWIDGF
jgi:hypothetical protein